MIALVSQKAILVVAISLFQKNLYCAISANEWQLLLPKRIGQGIRILRGPHDPFCNELHFLSFVVVRVVEWDYFGKGYITLANQYLTAAFYFV